MPVVTVPSGNPYRGVCVRETGPLTVTPRASPGNVCDRMESDTWVGETDHRSWTSSGLQCPQGGRGGGVAGSEPTRTTTEGVGVIHGRCGSPGFKSVTSTEAVTPVTRPRLPHADGGDEVVVIHRSSARTPPRPRVREGTRLVKYVGRPLDGPCHELNCKRNTKP